MDLRAYEQHKFAIAELLRSALARVPEQASDLRERLQPLFARLAEDRFNLVVVGRFNRGKTSLMNAILGVDRLPTGVVPLTSVITTVGYGSKERVVLKFRSRALDMEIPIEDLPQHVTQQGNPGNVRGVVTAEIELPVEILRRGFHFVDTPGLGSVIVENTLATESFLPEADAFVLVTSYESPLSEEEIRFFKAGLSSRKRIFVALNKSDILPPDHQQTVLRFVREQLSGYFGGAAPPIFSVSSTEGLAAKRTGDQARLLASGIPELEKQLVGFLLAEKSQEFLLRMCDRAKAFIQALPRPQDCGDLTSQIDALALELGGEARAQSIESLFGPVGAYPGLHQVRSCEICAEVAEKLWDFLRRHQYELTVDRAEQLRFAARGGLCPFHVRQLESMASPYGACAAYPALLDRLATALREAAWSGDVREMQTRAGHLTADDDSCALCRVRDAAERAAVEATAKRLETHGARALNALSAICLPHFAMLTSAVRDAVLLRGLLERQAAILQRSSEDMKRYVVKFDGARRYLASDEETTAAERGRSLVAGHRHVNFTPRRGAAQRADGSVQVERKEG